MRIVGSLTACALLALACAPAPKRQARWVTEDGKPVERAAVQAAAKVCEPKIAEPTRAGLYKGTVEWGVAMLDCLRESGYVLIYEDPHEIAPEQPQ
jgi:hypothetical protein